MHPIPKVVYFFISSKVYQWQYKEATQYLRPHLAEGHFVSSILYYIMAYRLEYELICYSHTTQKHLTSYLVDNM